jgi:hypothetical protein
MQRSFSHTGTEPPAPGVYGFASLFATAEQSIVIFDNLAVDSKTLLLS